MIKSKNDLIKIARYYLDRWRIEEYFKFKKQEYNFENFGSIKNNKINIVAIVYVLKFFLAISSMAVSYLLLFGLSLYTIQRTEI